MTTLAERIRADGFGDASPVLFYHPRDANGEGSNFSRHKVQLPCPFTGAPILYDTGEHRFQAMKATTRAGHDHVVLAPTPGQAKERGRCVTLRDGWGNDYGDLCWYVMTEVVIAKAQQNFAVAGWLRDTGDRPIYEDSPTDDIWGVRDMASYTGKNLLGRAWMYARGVLR